MSNDKIEPNEWEFGGCDDAELEYCTVFEYSRTSKVVTALIATLRERMANDPVRWKDNFGTDTLPDSEQRFTGLMWFFFLCGAQKYFSRPWLDIPENKRRQLRFCDDWTETGDERAIIQVRSCNENSLRWIQGHRPRDVSGRIVDSLNIISIDWRYTNKQILANFATWLRTIRPKGFAKIKSTGLGTWRERLNWLGAYRLLKVYSAKEAADYTYDYLKGKHASGTAPKPRRGTSPRREGYSLYGQASSWSDAKKMAKMTIRELEHNGWIGKPHQVHGWVSNNLVWCG